MSERQFWLMDERAMDPDQFEDATVYSVAYTLAEAREDRGEAGQGVIVEVEVKGDEAEWVRLVDGAPR